jgi:hypothetical protein
VAAALECAAVAGAAAAPCALRRLAAVFEAAVDLAGAAGCVVVAEAAVDFAAVGVVDEAAKRGLFDQPVP